MKKLKELFQDGRALVKKFIAYMDFGITHGLGDRGEGTMCVQACMMTAMGLEHSDHTVCVDDHIRSYLIRLNDTAGWDSIKHRSKGLKRVGIAQLGSDELDTITIHNALEKQFLKHFGVHDFDKARLHAAGSNNRLQTLAECIVQGLIEAGSPGCEWLDMAPMSRELQEVFGEEAADLHKQEAYQTTSAAAKMAMKKSDAARKEVKQG